uniref:Solute carrier family 16 member 12b n=1 Tax=Cyprinodon variegatus TaxID=28743 RepID=A0A3Q2CB45_CYPVA
MWLDLRRGRQSWVIRVNSRELRTQPWGGAGVQGDDPSVYLSPISTFLCVFRCISIFFAEFQAHFGATYSSTAWIHSLVDCTTMLFAPAGSLLGNRYSCRVAVMLGGLLSSCGLLLSSFASSLDLLYLSMGVLTGLGFALCYTPAIALVGCYFQRRRALAYGIAMSGSGIGTFVLAPVVQLLIDLYTWRGALLVLSAFVANLCVCGALLRPITVQKGEEVETGDENLSSCFRLDSEYSFLLLPDFLGLAASFLFLASGCSLPFVYLVPYALSVGVSQQNAAFLMSILGAIDIVGNITFGWLTDTRCLKPYRLICYIVAVAMESLCCFLVSLLRTFAQLVPFAVVYGYFDGAYVALIPVVTSDVVGVPYLSSALGVVYLLHAIPYLFSPPIGGWLVDVAGNYIATFTLSGAALLASALIVSLVTGIRSRRLSSSKHKPLPLVLSNQSDCCSDICAAKPEAHNNGISDQLDLDTVSPAGQL